MQFMVEESKYCSEVMKKYFNKRLVMAKEDNETFKNSTNNWICGNDCIYNDVIWVGFLGVQFEGD